MDFWRRQPFCRRFCGRRRWPWGRRSGRSARELRLRRGRPGTALLRGREYVLSGPPIGEGDLRAVLEAATRASLHAAGPQLAGGFVSAPGGVRVGVCGAAVMGG
ncbi:MAG: hypothetical protein LUG57_07225, partial [Oscillospiraceae bacterium]|nr:hypothetical protein [Oscillospiraceae bacterium]